jgi:hypothetical protein
MADTPDIPDKNTPIPGEETELERNPMYKEIARVIGVELPLYVDSIDFDDKAFSMEINVTYPPDARFSCECGESNLPVHRKHRRKIQTSDCLNYAAYIIMDMPSVCCPKCGIKPIPLKWVETGETVTKVKKKEALPFVSNLPLSVASLFTGLSPKKLASILKQSKKPKKS